MLSRFMILLRQQQHRYVGRHRAAEPASKVATSPHSVSVEVPEVLVAS